MSNKKIAVIGGDKRLSYLAEDLSLDGFEVSGYGIFGKKSSTNGLLDDALYNSYAVVLPFPVSPDGVYLNATECAPVRLSELFDKIRKYNVSKVFGGSVSRSVNELAEKYSISICDYGKLESVALKNALCTAEGALEIALRELDVTIHSSVITVLGYGRIGNILSRELKALGAKVRAVARKPEDIARIQLDGITPFYFKDLKKAVSESVLIFNTVPSVVIDSDILSDLKNNPLIIDLASAPGGIDRDSAKSLGIQVIWALSIPGKSSPKTAASIIKEALLLSL